MPWIDNGNGGWQWQNNYDDPGEVKGVMPANPPPSRAGAVPAGTSGGSGGTAPAAQGIGTNQTTTPET